MPSTRSKSAKKQPLAPPLVEQLEDTFTRLKKRFPELIGIGLGYRRRRGRVVPEVTVKLQVRKKIRHPEKEMRLLPKHVKLTTIALGQPVTISVPTDIEAPQRMTPTFTTVDGMKVAMLAAWLDEQGSRRFGVISAGHGLEQQTTPVELADGTHAVGQVVAKSDLVRDGYDVGLVDVDVAPAQLPQLSSELPVPASAQQLLDMISLDPQDNISVEGETWSSSNRETIQALAFFVSWQWQGLPSALKHVVQCGGTIGTFERGTSGSVWTTKPPGRLVMAIQSHAHEPKYSQAEGTHFLSAVEWLMQQPGIYDLRIAWQPSDLPQA